jgi:hypothetical protein
MSCSNPSRSAAVGHAQLLDAERLEQLAEYAGHASRKYRAARP